MLLIFLNIYCITCIPLEMRIESKSETYYLIHQSIANKIKILQVLQKCIINTDIKEFNNTMYIDNSLLFVIIV